MARGKPGQVRLRIDNSKMRAEVGIITKDAVRRGAAKAQENYQNNIRADGLVNSGKLLSSVTQQDVPGREVLAPAIAVGTPLDYAKYPEYGTRAHGPVRAKALRFKPKGSNTFVFAKRVRGVKPYRFAQRALDSLRPRDFEP